MNKKGAVSETISWFVALIAISIILVLYLVFSFGGSLISEDKISLNVEGSPGGGYEGFLNLNNLLRSEIQRGSLTYVPLNLFSNEDFYRKNQRDLEKHLEEFSPFLQTDCFSSILSFPNSRISHLYFIFSEEKNYLFNEASYRNVQRNVFSTLFGRGSKDLSEAEFDKVGLGEVRETPLKLYFYNKGNSSELNWWSVKKC